MRPGTLASGAATSNRLRGFTLVEVMVALTVLSLVLMATVSALRTLANTQGALERTTTRVDDMRSVSSFLRDLLASSVIGEDLGGLSAGGGSSEATYFIVGKDYLEFESSLLFGENFGGSYLVRVAQEEQSLVLRWQERPRNGIPADWGEMPSRVMVDQLDSFSIATRADYDEQWLEYNHRRSHSPPALVRMQIGSGGRHWPTLIMKVPQ